MSEAPSKEWTQKIMRARMLDELRNELDAMNRLIEKLHADLARLSERHARANRASRWLDEPWPRDDDGSD